MAVEVSERSLCDRAQVGCIVVDEDQNVLASTYNGPPPGFEVSGTCKNWCPRAMGKGEISNDYSNCFSSHAEINGIARMIPTNKKTTAYINRACCNSCAKALAAANVSRVVCLTTDYDGHLNSDDTENFLLQSGVVVDYLFDKDIAK